MSKVKKFKILPKFKNEDEERDFWSTHDATDYFDWSKARRVSFPNLKPSSAVVTLRMPQDMVADVKIFAKQKDVPYQSFMKMMIARQLLLERAGCKQK